MYIREIGIQRDCESSNHHHRGSASKASKNIALDLIITFFERLVMKAVASIPDNRELNLPHFQKQEVYAFYRLYLNRLYLLENPSSMSYFYSIWNEYCSHIKCRKSPRLQKCPQYERLSVVIRTAFNENMTSMQFFRQQKLDHEFIACERRGQSVNTDLSKDQPFKYLSISVDGVYQSRFALPRFVTPMKDQRGHGLCIHLIGVIQRASIHHLRLYTMTRNHSKGANHIVKSIYRVIDDKASLQKLPRKLFMQLDNCSRENKNKYLMGLRSLKHPFHQMGICIRY